MPVKFFHIFSITFPSVIDIKRSSYTVKDSKRKNWHGGEYLQHIGDFTLQNLYFHTPSLTFQELSRQYLHTCNAYIPGIMKLLLPLFSFFSILTACSSTPDDPKKSIRIGWQTYFNAYLDFHGKESQLGTDSTRLVFENNSDYAVDSAILIFENQGLLVHSFDTVCIKSILHKTKKALQAPSHKLGFNRILHIYDIYSKPLEFGYRADLPEEKRKGDCYHCK